MNPSDNSNCSNSDLKSRRLFFKKKKLNILLAFRDSLERRIAALDASINKLKEQIERDENSEE